MPPEAVRAELAAILGSESFASATRHRRFLEFVVEQTLAGKSEFIKESVLGAEVFDRPADFDPRADAIVRIEATKLRARVAAYYEGPGKDHALRIDIPKGTYVPRFTRPGAPKRSFHLGWRTAAAAGVVLAVAAGVAWVALPAPEAEAPAIAVLPFVNLSPDPNDAYFSDGLVEQLTDALAHIDGLRVAARTSAFAFKGKQADVTEIAKKLHVDTLVEGSVRRSGDKVRITAQLVQAKDGYHRWSETFERDLRDVFALQDEMSRAIAGALRANLAGQAPRPLHSRAYSNDPQAIDLYLRGRFALSGGEGLDLSGRALSFFEQAVARDPNFALAHSGMSAALAIRSFESLRPPAELIERTRSAALQALALDPALAEPLSSLGFIEARCDWNWAGTEQRYLKSLALNPQSSALHYGYAHNVLLPLRRFEEALAENRMALEIDPLSMQMAAGIPWILAMQGKGDEALAEAGKLAAANPDSGYAVATLVHAYLETGRNMEAIALLEPHSAELPATMLVELELAYGRQGRSADAGRLATRLAHLYGTETFAGLITEFGLGHLAEARRIAAGLIHAHDPNVYVLALDPLLAPLREDPEFARTLKPVGLPF